MKGNKVGYIRVSSTDQNMARQLDSVNCDKIFTDKVSGKSIERPGLKSMLEYIREGDEVIVHSMDRLARNLDDLRKMVFDLTSKGISIKFIKENLTFTSDSDPMSKLLLSVMGAVAEFERMIIKERQKEGIALAKSKGLYTGRKRILNGEQVLEIKAKIIAGYRKTDLAKEYGIKRSTLYKYLKGMFNKLCQC
jgi:DNA invertase Pin-like site-specific DNA recombinase